MLLIMNLKMYCSNEKKLIVKTFLNQIKSCKLFSLQWFIIFKRISELSLQANFCFILFSLLRRCFHGLGARFFFLLLWLDIRVINTLPFIVSVPNPKTIFYVEMICDVILFVFYFHCLCIFVKVIWVNVVILGHLLARVSNEFSNIWLFCTAVVQMSCKSASHFMTSRMYGIPFKQITKSFLY